MGVLSGYRVSRAGRDWPRTHVCDAAVRHGRRRAPNGSHGRTPGLGIAMDPKYSLLNRGRRSVALDLKTPEAVEACLALMRTADALSKVSARRDGAARARPRRGAGAQPEAGLRPHDRLGPGRPAGAGRRPRHQLHLGDRRAGRDRHARRSRSRRSTWSAISAAARSISWSACSPRCWKRGIRQGTGGRCRDVRRRGLADVDVLRPVRRGPLDRGARQQFPRRRRAFLRRL